ncbi:hypothetical protein ACSBR1_030631 [Camellia fascicularis]
MPEESINSSIGLDIESLSAEIQTNCQNLETKHGVKQWPYRMQSFVRWIGYMHEAFLNGFFPKDKVGEVKNPPYSRPVYCMRKEDLLPTLHFSGLRSLHCINKRSLLCISLVEDIPYVDVSN